jgi:hypothetical protein
MLHAIELSLQVSDAVFTDSEITVDLFFHLLQLHLLVVEVGAKLADLIVLLSYSLIDLLLGLSMVSRFDALTKSETAYFCLDSGPFWTEVWNRMSRILKHFGDFADLTLNGS